MDFFLKTKYKTEPLFLIKKIISTFWLKNSRMQEKEHWWPKRRICYWGLCRNPYHWGLKADPITDDPWDDPITEKPKDSGEKLTEKRSGVSGSSLTYAPQKTLFGFLVVIYGRVGDGDDFHIKILVLESLVFMLRVT